MAQKIVACIFSQNYLSELVPQVYKKLEVEGYFDADDPEMQGNLVLCVSKIVKEILYW